MKRLLLFVVVLTGTVVIRMASDAANILAIFPMKMTSHFRISDTVARILADQASHNVTVVHPFAAVNARPTNINYHTVDVSANCKAPVIPCTSNDQYFGATLRQFVYFELELCRCVYENPNFRQFLRDNRYSKFQVMLVETYNVNCFSKLAGLFNSTMVNVVTSRTWPVIDRILRNPVNPSYLPHMLSSRPTRMNFVGRLFNTLNYLSQRTEFYTYNNKPSADYRAANNGEDSDDNDNIDDNNNRNYYSKDNDDDLPIERLLPVDDLFVNEIALTFYHSHLAVHSRPMMPNAVEIAGIHLHQESSTASISVQLPSQLEEFLKTSGPGGVLLFALGSAVDGSRCIEQDKAEMFLQAFAEIRQRVIWKYRNVHNLTIPSNVLLLDWLPQVDILRRDEVLAFISHGGISSIYESIMAGKPIIGIPLRFDQPSNLAILQEKGVAVVLSDFHRITKHRLVHAIRRVTENTRYSDKMRDLSKQFRDRPVKPSQLILHWIDHIIQHGNPNHRPLAAGGYTKYAPIMMTTIMITIIIISIIPIILVIVIAYRRNGANY